MKESQLHQRILKALNETPEVQAIKIHGSRFARAGEPDILGCFRGQMFAIEVKTATGKLTKLQAKRLDGWKRAGAHVGVARNVSEAWSIVWGEKPWHVGQDGTSSVQGVET